MPPCTGWPECGFCRPPRSAHYIVADGRVVDLAERSPVLFPPDRAVTLPSYAQRDAYYSRMIYRPTEEAPVTDSPYTYTDRDGDVVKVAPADEGGTDTAYVSVSRYGAYVEKDAAPLVALALLEAAGWDTFPIGTAYGADWNADHALRNLRGYKLAVERKAELAKREAEAKADAEALDAEAHALREAWYPDNRTPFASLDEDTKRDWRNVARKARSIAAKAAEEADAS